MTLTKFKLGFNLICAGNRFPEPEEWTRIARQEFDLDYIQFSSDVLDPLWPQDYVQEYLERTKRCLRQYELVVDSMFTGVFTRRHLLLHPDAGGRALWFAWYEALIRAGAIIGAKSVGSHFGALTMKDAADPARYRQRVDEAIKRWQELSQYAKEMGMQYMFFETMSIRREMADTIAAAKELYERLNEKSALPILMCLDVGHSPHPTERDPYLWLRELSPYACMVHLQQTEADHSRHWPFTPEYNAIGIIDADEVLTSIEQSGAKEMYLHFEIFHRESFELEASVLPDIRESVQYWRNHLTGHHEVRLPRTQSIPAESA
jgi:sugar phosphate isomerase/epimerase